MREEPAIDRHRNGGRVKRERFAIYLILGLALASAAPARAQSDSARDSAAAAAPSTEEVMSRLESMGEQLQTLQVDTDKLKRFKFSGYVQARWLHAENQSDTVKVSGVPLTLNPANQERFFIRRARLKLTYDASPLSQGVVYLNGGEDRFVKLLEAYVMLLDPWTPDHRNSLTFGQFNVPFGYEIERSSSVREMLERSRAQNVLFPGERDRGIRLVNPWTPRLETAVSVLNGGGIQNVNFPDTDPSSGKDLTLRARYSQGTIDAAVSLYDGRETIPLTGPDVEVDRTRIGGDAQFYYALPRLGGGSLKGEYYAGTNVNSDSVTALLVRTGDTLLVRPLRDPAHLATDFQGGYIMLVQNLGEQFQVAGRYDWYDQNVDLDHDQYKRVGVAAHYFYDGYTRFTIEYDIPTTEKKIGSGYQDPKDNTWTFQAQIKF